ncbi:MAG: hypothetical protein RIC35_10085 [Marinoscillum sp.]
MTAYRETIIQNILKSNDKFEMSTIVDTALQKLKEHGTHPFIVLRFVAKLKISLTEMKPETTTEMEKNNIVQALRVLERY